MQGSPALPAVHQYRVLTSTPSQESPEFPFQGLISFHHQRVWNYIAPLVSHFQPKTLNLLLLIVHRIVTLVRQEDAQLPHLLRGHARGREVCNAPGLQGYSGVGYVDSRREHADTGGPDFRDGAVIQGMQYLEVMDHQVEHDIDIQAPGRENRQSMNLDEAGLPFNLHQSLDGRIEELDVADSQNPVPSRGHQAVGFFQVRCQRLLDQDVDSLLEQITSDLTMIDGRHRDYGSLQATGKFGQAVKDPGTELLRDTFSRAAIRIEDAHQLGARILGQDAHVVPTQSTGADDSDSDGTR